jgi:hypothetical protein
MGSMLTCSLVIFRVQNTVLYGSEETQKIVDNSDDVVELEKSCELERLGAPYGRSDVSSECTTWSGRK